MSMNVPDKDILELIITHFMDYIRSETFILLDTFVDSDKSVNITWTNKTYRHSYKPIGYIKSQTNIGDSKITYHNLIHKNIEGLGLFLEEEGENVIGEITRYDPLMKGFKKVTSDFQPCLTLLLKIIGNK